MITRIQATMIAEEYIKQLSASSEIEVALIEDNTLSASFGWVFFYDATANIEVPGSFPIGGNGPIIVDINDGSVHETGTAYPVEYYLENYEKSGSPYPGASKQMP